MRPLRAASALCSVVLVVAMSATGVASAEPAPGQQLWVARHDGPAHGDDHAAAIARSADGSVIYVGGSVAAGGGKGHDLAVLAYGASGGLRWVGTYDGPGNGADAAAAIAAGPARVYVAGRSDGGPTGGDYATIAYTSGGELLWARRYDGAHHGNDIPKALAVSRDGATIVVTGSTATIAYTSDGTKLWTRRSTPGTYLAFAPDGSRVFVARVDGDDIVTIGIDASTGARLWVERYPVHTPDEPPSVAGVVVSPDGGRLYVGAFIIHEMGERAPGVLAYATDGAFLWESDLLTQVYGPPTSLALSPRGDRIYVGGDAGPSICVAAFDADGTQVWLHTETETSGHLAGLTVSPDGRRVLAAGRAIHDGTADYMTFTLSRGGESRWSAWYDGTVHGTDEAVGLVMSPDGSTAFVTGNSEGLGTGMDIVTVAYRAS